MIRRTLGAALQGAAAAMSGGPGYQQQTRIADLLRELGIGTPIPTQASAGPYRGMMTRPMTPPTARGFDPTRTGRY